jgi:exodeoxyribonuclease VII large subunit
MPEGTFTVAELVGAIDQALHVLFPSDVWVEGEISALKAVPLDRGDPRGPRHIFFDLIEPTPESGAPSRPRAVLPVKLFDSQRQRVNAYLRRHGSIKMTDGVRVRIGGSLQLYAGRSQIELRMNLLDPSYTLALLATERELVLRRLAADGLLDRNAGMPLSPVPLRVGLVTSAGSAAAADFTHELELSGFGWHVLLADSRVQGRGADQLVEAAIAAVVEEGVDVVALVRGGGSRTELATFDAEGLARAIAGCPVPVLTGIGHEVDDSVADRVAHMAYKTPTACAAALVGRVGDFLARCDEGLASVQSAAGQACRTAAERIHRAGARVESTTRLQLSIRSGRVESASNRLLAVVPGQLRRATTRLDHVESQVRALDPDRALARGWSITRTADGRTVRSADDLGVDDELLTTFVDGLVSSRVSGVRRPATDEEAGHR